MSFRYNQQDSVVCRRAVLLAAIFIFSLAMTEAHARDEVTARAYADRDSINIGDKIFTMAAKKTYKV